MKETTVIKGSSPAFENFIKICQQNKAEGQERMRKISEIENENITEEEKLLKISNLYGRKMNIYTNKNGMKIITDGNLESVKCFMKHI